MKRLTVSILLIICCISMKGNTQIKNLPNFRIGLKVQCENKIIQSKVEINMKRKIREIGDIDMVEGRTKNPLWLKLISIHILEHQYMSGESTGRVSICTDIYSKIGLYEFNKFQQNFRKEFPAIEIPTGSISTCNTDNLTEYCENIVNELDNQLQWYRDNRKRYFQQ